MVNVTFRLTNGTVITVDERDINYDKPMEGFVSVWIRDENIIRVWPARQIEQIEIKPERVLKVVESEAA